MHTSSLRGSDFQLALAGETISHHDFFSSFTAADRLGLIAPDRLDGLGAAALVLAHVTAFYDHRRCESEDFFSYPDFFSFQPSSVRTDYGMLDIWPAYKNVDLPDDPCSRMAAVSGHNISILVVPDVSSHEPPSPSTSADRATLDSLQRTVNHCYAYSPACLLPNSDFVVECRGQNTREWGATVIERAQVDDSDFYRERWDGWFGDGVLSQSYRRIGLDEALASLTRPGPGA